MAESSRSIKRTTLPVANLTVRVLRPSLFTLLASGAFPGELAATVWKLYSDEEARKKFLGLRGEVDDQLSELYSAHDCKKERGLLTEIRGLLNRRRYIQNLVSEVEKELAP